MKKCYSIEKKLMAYLHGELKESDIQAVETHLQSCATCRAELEAQRVTLDLLGTTLSVAPAPEQLSPWRKPVLRPQNIVQKILFSPILRALLSASAIHCALFLIAGMFVVFTVVKIDEPCFEAPRAIERPKMKLRKPKVMLRKPTAQLKKSSAPKSTQRLTLRESRSSMPDILLPELAGTGSGLSDGFSEVEIESLPSFSSGLTYASDTGERSEALARTDLKEEAEIVTVLGLAADSDDAFGLEPEEKTVPSESDRSGLFSDNDVSRQRQSEAAVFNPYIQASENPFSTFSIDVDTASYGLARQKLLEGGIPNPEQVRTEEFINSFDYNYRPPTGKQTFAVHTEMAPSPFRPNMELLKIGIKGRRIGRDDHRGAVLTLVIDTSGSMAAPDRLDLVKQSLVLLVDQLDPSDQVAIVQFGGDARLVLEHTPVSDKPALLKAIYELQPGGPTQFDKGLELGYQLATDAFSAGDSNRIMILSDGVANLGELDPEAILRQVAEYRTQGIYLSVLGFGAGTYDDDLLERLANKGDGMYAYIDSMNEARHMLVDQLAATLHVIASDVKIQVEFNPARVLRYRQLGYENRQLTKEQFRDDSVDAGEVGSGQSVTALYDVELNPAGPLDEPIATVYVRYRRADNGSVEEISSRVTDLVRVQRFEESNVRFQLAACVAEFAERLRRNPYTEGTEIRDILSKLRHISMELELDDQVKELLRLISIAEGLSP